MKTEKILFPVDLAKCPVEAFPLVNDITRNHCATVILLNVVILNILSPNNDVYDELCREAQTGLQRLVANYLHPMVETCLRVRVGNPAEEIAAEATEQRVSLIVLPLFKSSFWKRLFAPVVSDATEKLMRNAPCPIFALPMKASFNYEDKWRTTPDFQRTRKPSNNWLVTTTFSRENSGI